MRVKYTKLAPLRGMQKNKWDPLIQDIGLQ